MEKVRIKLLLKKYRDSTLSELERAELENFFEDFGKSDVLADLWNEDYVAHEVDLSDSQIEDSLQEVLNDNRLTNKTPVLRLREYFTIAAAAILLIISSIFFISKLDTDMSIIDPIVAHRDAIIPGSKDARLEFEDGTYVEFDKINKDTILVNKGLKVLVDAAGNVTYELLRSKHDSYATIVTPRGGEYNLTLADGTKVWMNSESRLRYPLTFNADKRIVTMEGEVYFEVAKYKHDHKNIPFIVESNNQLIEVLGTRFNVNSYENIMYTTLIEGSVKVADSKSTFSQLLQPNQQFVFNSSRHKGTVKEVDVFYVSAWKDGLFAFQGASVEKVMKDLARWYDIDVSLEGDFSGIKYSGTISRTEEFSEILKIIEMTNQVKFKIDGRRVYVMKK